MSTKSSNWWKFGGLVGLAFAFGVFFAGLVDSPSSSQAQSVAQGHSPPATPVTFNTTPPVAAKGAQSLVDLSEGFAAVAEAVKPSVVLIESQRGLNASDDQAPHSLDDFFRRDSPRFQEGRGSGFVVSTDGYILTNNHVVDGAERVRVQLPDRREFLAEVIGTDPNTDLAVLKIEAEGLQPIALGDSDAARVGEWVLAIGNPLGDQLTFTVTSGIISARGRSLRNLPGRSNTSIHDFIQTDAAINPGNSGGPLVNLSGQVIGINSAIASETGFNMGYGFAIPINLARNVMTQLIETGTVHRAALMVNIIDVGPDDAEYVGLDRIRGVLISDIPNDNSPARRAGMRPGDIVLSVDGKEVNYVAELQQEIGFRRPGDKVEVEVARKGGERRTFEVTLAPLDTDPQLTQAQPEPEQPEEDTGSNLELLGITVQPLTDVDIQELQLTDDDVGLVVTAVRPGGPSWEKLQARRAGADIIVSVEGQRTKTEADLRRALRSNEPGSIIELEVVTPTANGPFRRVVRVRLGGS